MSALTTERVSVVARPEFEVGGDPQPRLSTDLIRLEVWHDEEGLSRLEFTVVNWDARRQGDPPGHVYFDGKVVDFGDEIEVWAGDEDNRASIFTGVITAIRGTFASLRPAELTVCAEDRLQWLRMGQRSRTFKNKDDAGIARDVAGDHGLTGSPRTDGPQHEQLWQVNQSDLAFLRERARAVDARLGVAGREIVFRPRRERGGPEPVSLSPAAELVHFEVGADLAHQRTRVRVHGYSVKDKAGIHQSADDSAVQPEADGGRTGASILESLSIRAVEDLHLEAPFVTDEARRLAEAEMLRRARGFVQGRGVTDGTPGLAVGARVRLVDTGPLFDGVYHVSAVHHSFDQASGLRTEFEVERVDVGRPR